MRRWALGCVIAVACERPPTPRFVDEGIHLGFVELDDRIVISAMHGPLLLGVWQVAALDHESGARIGWFVGSVEPDQGLTVCSTATLPAAGVRALESGIERQPRIPGVLHCQPEWKNCAARCGY